MAMSASMNWMPWNAAIGWPNWLALLGVADGGVERGLGDAHRLRARSPGRDASSVRMATLKPSPSSPRRLLDRDLAVGEVQRHRGRAADAELALGLPTAKPGVPGSTRNAVTPLARLAGSTVANTVMTPAWAPLVTHILEPLST